MGRYPALIFFACLAAGAAVAQGAGGAPVFYFAAGGAALGLAVLSLSGRAFVPLICVASIALGGAVYAASPAHSLERAWREALSGGETAAITGTVSDRFTRRQSRFGATKLSFVLGELESGSRKLPGKLKVSAPVADLRYGDRVRVEGKISPPTFRRNPAGYDEAGFFRHAGVGAKMRATRIEKIAGPSGILGGVYLFKNAVLARFDELPPLAAGFSKALFLGERTNLDPAFRAALVRTGTMHYFAISGSNVALVAGCFVLLLALAGAGEKTIAAVCLPVLAVYCLAAGLNPPVLRATIMAAIVAIGVLSDRRAAALHSLGLTGAIMFFLNPEEITDAGFQLSFAAVFGLIAIGRPFARAYSAARLRGSPARRARAVIFAAAAVSLIAWTATAPFTIEYFHQVHFLSPLANLVLLPAVTLLNLLVLAYAALLFLPAAWLWPLGLGVEASSRVLVWIVEAFDGADAWRMPASAWIPATWIALAIGVWALVRSKRIRRPDVRLAAIFLLATNCILFDAAVAKAQPVRPVVSFFDVGHGDAILFEFSNGSTMLVDTGEGSPDGEFAISPYLRSRGIRRIDAIVITHPHYDHCGALESLLEDFEVGLIVDNGDPGEAFHGRTVEKIKAKGVRHEKLRRGDQLVGFPGAQLRVLHPAQSFEGSVNDRSLVIDARIEGRSVLLTGDAGEASLAEWIREAPSPVDLLKIPHHGGKGGDNLLALFRKKPKLAVAQLGMRYGMPYLETWLWASKLSGRALRTDADGAVRVDLRTLRLQTARERAR